MKIPSYKVSVSQTECVEVKDNVTEIEIVDNNIYMISKLENLFNITHTWIIRSMKNESNLSDNFDHKKFFNKLQNLLINRKIELENDEVINRVYKIICECGGFLDIKDVKNIIEDFIYKSDNIIRS